MRKAAIVIAVLALLWVPTASAAGREVLLNNDSRGDAVARLSVDGRTTTVPLNSFRAYPARGVDPDACIRIWRSGGKPDEGPCEQVDGIRFGCKEVQCVAIPGRAGQPLEIRISVLFAKKHQ